jgi:N6-adenosine-specific RNA methylase IME4
MTLEFHPLANLFPLLEGEEFDALVGSMKEHGYRSGEEIVLYEGKILDGRNRYRAACAADILAADLSAPAHDRYFVEFPSDGFANGTFGGEESQAGPLAYVIDKNLRRRHLNESQRAMVASRVATLRPGESAALKQRSGSAKDGPSKKGKRAKDDAAADPQAEEMFARTMGAISQAEAGKTLAVSERSVRHARTVQDDGEPELVAAVDSGKMAVSLAAQAAKLPAEQQRQVVAEANAGRANAVRTVVKREARAQKEIALAGKQCALPDKKYGVILADPEWRFEPYSRASGLDRSPCNHYPTSSTDVIASRPVVDIAAKDCVLFLWATAPMLPAAIRVMESWGFDYKSHCVWRKLRQGKQRGTGYWFTSEHELLLVGTRGSVPAPAPGKQWGSVLDREIGAHSAKPDSFHILIESYFPNLPKIELNARTRRDGWDAWGLEAPPQGDDEGWETLADLEKRTKPKKIPRGDAETRRQEKKRKHKSAGEDSVPRKAAARAIERGVVRRSASPRLRVKPKPAKQTKRPAKKGAKR